MSVELVHLTTCPYCKEGHGEIRVDLERIASLHESYGDDWLRADLSPELNPFVLSSDQRDLGPCKHLVFLTGSFFYLDYHKRNSRGGRTWEVTCDWWRPAVDQLDDGLESFVVHLTNEVDLLPGEDVPMGTEWFTKEWPDQEYGGWPLCRYRFDGRVFFCRDAAAFFKDLREKDDQYTAWWNGDDPLGAGLFVEGFTAEQLSRPAPVRVAPACQAVDHADEQHGCCEGECYGEADYSESDADDES